MSFETIDVHCPDCSSTWDLLIDRADRDGFFPCPICQKDNAVRTFSVPNVTRASYVDGNRRFDKFKEASALDREAAVSKGDKRKEIAKEIKKLGVRVSKDII